MLSCHSSPPQAGFFQIPVLKPTMTPRFIPYESWCVASRVAWDALSPNTTVSSTGLGSQCGVLNSAQQRATSLSYNWRPQTHPLSLIPAPLLHAQLGLQVQADLKETLARDSGLLSPCLVIYDMMLAIPVSQGYQTIMRMKAGQATKMAGPVSFPTPQPLLHLFGLSSPEVGPCALFALQPVDSVV